MQWTEGMALNTIVLGLRVNHVGEWGINLPQMMVILSDLGQAVVDKRI